MVLGALRLPGPEFEGAAEGGAPDGPPNDIRGSEPLGGPGGPPPSEAGRSSLGGPAEGRPRPGMPCMPGGRPPGN